ALALFSLSRSAAGILGAISIVTVPLTVDSKISLASTGKAVKASARKAAAMVLIGDPTTVSRTRSAHGQLVPRPIPRPPDRETPEGLVHGRNDATMDRTLVNKARGKGDVRDRTVNRCRAGPRSHRDRAQHRGPATRRFGAIEFCADER